MTRVMTNYADLERTIRLEKAIESLGSSVFGDSTEKKSSSYQLGEDCFSSLQLIERELSSDDLTSSSSPLSFPSPAVGVSRRTRIILWKKKVVEKHLIPILLLSSESAADLRGVTVRILSKLTLPLECFFHPCPSPSNYPHPYPSSVAFNQLQQTLLDYKKTFLISHFATGTLVKWIRSSGYILETPRNEFSAVDTSEIIGEQGNSTTAFVNDCLILIRNLLHVPDVSDFYQFEPFRPPQSTGIGKIEQDSNKQSSSEKSRNTREEWQDVYKKLLWNFCVQGLDAALLSILGQKLNQVLSPTIVQLITLLFKDQHVVQLQRILQSGRVNQESSDDDVDSDSSSSVQRSSSSSIVSSDSSSSSSSHSSLENGSSNCCRKGGNDSSSSQGRSPSDSGISSEPRTSSTSGHSGDDIPCSVSTTAAEKDSEESIADVSQRMEESCHVSGSPIEENNSNEENNDVSSRNMETSEASTMVLICNIDKEEEKMSSQDVKEQPETPKIKEEEHTTTCSKCPDILKKTNSREEQTSGISNGSSEEEQTRITRKVMKPHHRSNACTSKPNESDSSEEYNSKPPDHPSSGNSLMAPDPGGVRGRGYLPHLLRSKCSPSVCLEAALFAAKANSTTSSTSVGLIPPWEKKKNVCGSKNFPLGMDSFVPSDEDIGFLLKDFVLKFLHNSFSSLVLDLKDQIIRRKVDLDCAHLYWLISYFGKLAVSIDLDYHHVEPLLSIEMFGFLAYQGVLLNEDMELHVTRKHQASPSSSPSSGESSLTATSSSNSKCILRKMHLVVSTIRELFYAILNYGQHRGHDSDLRRLRFSLAEMTDLRQMLLLYIRSFLPTVHTKQFLIEVITTHHIAMLILEPVYLEGRFDLPLHLRQFATIQVMDHYGKILQDFRTNTEFVNDCVLTLMHHVAGDLMSPECLFQPIILKTFSLIMESDMEVKDCWGDLIEYIMIRFVRAAKKSPAACIRKMFGEVFPSKTLNSSGSSETSSTSDSHSLVLVPTTSSSIPRARSDRDRLYWLYLQFEQAVDPIGMIVDALVDEFNVHIDKSEVISQLLAKGIINEDEYESFRSHDSKSSPSSSSLSNEKNEMAAKDSGEKDAISLIVDEICKSDMKQQVLWIQDVLLKIGSVKLAVTPSEVANITCHSIPFYSNVIGEECPLVPFNEKQEMALNSAIFVSLLHELHLHLPDQQENCLYPRVPTSLSPSDILEMCLKLAPIDESLLNPKYMDNSSKRTATNRGANISDQSC